MGSGLNVHPLLLETNGGLISGHPESRLMNTQTDIIQTHFFLFLLQINFDMATYIAVRRMLLLCVSTILCKLVSLVSLPDREQQVGFETTFLFPPHLLQFFDQSLIETSKGTPVGCSRVSVRAKGL